MHVDLLKRNIDHAKKSKQRKFWYFDFLFFKTLYPAYRSSPPSEDGLALKVPTQIQEAISELQTQTKQVMIGMERMLKAMNSMGSSSQRSTPPELPKTADQ